ncbi:MAG: hypothetical protein RL301_805, partial [Actinomycetota bacterium]
LEIKVDNAVVTEDQITEQLDELRARFGTLHEVQRAIKSGDFVNIDLVAKINGEEVEGGTANDISYEVGSNRMVDGLDAALEGLSVGESKSFDTQLVGQQDGEKGEVAVTVRAVKERELPPLDDAFAKLASEFDTLADLKKDVAERLERLRKLEQGAQARDRLIDKLVAELEIPIPDEIVEQEIHDHLEREGRLEDKVHREEVDRDTRAALKQDFLLDAVVKSESVDVNEMELTEYLVRTSQRYGMAPDKFAEELQKAGQINQLISEVARTKALANILSRITVTDESGKKVDLEELRPKPAAAAETPAE